MKRIARLNLQQASENTVENLPEVCIYPKCSLKSIEGYNFCYQHVYADKLTKKNKKCTYKTNENVCNELITLPNDDNRHLCTFHSTLEKQAGKVKDATDPCSSDESKYKLVDDLNIDCKNALNEQAIRKLTEGVNSSAGRQQQQPDEDLIDFELFDSEDSDNLEDDLDYEDALEHASVYTPEEVLKIFQVKLNKLQRLYKKQLNLLNDRMKYDRKVYLLLNENEKLKYGPDHELDFKNQAEKELLKAAKLYKKYSGLKTYLRENFTQKSTKDEATSNTATIAFLSKPKPQCVFIEKEKKCEKKPIPLSKYCMNHILNDQMQILFCACGESECKEPVVASLTPNCPLHLSTRVVEKLKANEEATSLQTTSQETQLEHQAKTMTHTAPNKQEPEDTDSETDNDSDDANETKETSTNKSKRSTDISQDNDNEDSNTSTSSSSSTSSTNSDTSTTSNSSSTDSSDSSSSSNSSSASPTPENQPDKKSTETEMEATEQATE